MPQKRGFKGPASLLFAAALTATTLAASTAHADENDIVLSRLGTIVTDSTGNPIDVIGNNLEFRSMVSELGVVLAPRLATPADTLGFGGFQFSADLSYTSITNDASYWRVLESSSNPAGGTGSHGSGFMPTVGVFMRKGIWFPLPSFEVGVGAVHLMRSGLWTAQGYAKFAVHEGYHDLPLPSIAVRGAAARAMGSRELDLTVASVDIIASKAIGIQGTTTLEPYGGWDLLIIVPRSEVVDKTPQVDLFDTPGDGVMNFVFKDQDNITRHRFFGGLKLKYYVFTIGLEAAIALAGSSVDDRGSTDVSCADITSPTTSCDSEDQARSQQSFTMTMGMDF